MPYIDDAVKQTKKRLHKTQNKDDPTEHRTHVCIVCDCFVMATEPLRTMNRAQLKALKHRLPFSLNNITSYHFLICYFHKDQERLEKDLSLVVTVVRR